MSKTKFRQTEIGEIPEGWSIGKVSDLVNVRSGYAIKSSDFCKSGVGVIKIKNIDSERVDLFDTDKVTPAFFETLPDEYRVSYGDVLIAMTGATIGKTGKIRSTNERYVLNQRVARFVSNDLWDLEYIFQYTLSREFINSIHNLATGAAQQNISADNIVSIPMLIPPKEERLRIAKILSDLDEKIELNNQMNKALESIAQAIFKRWFVDFEFPDACGRPGKYEEVPLGTLVTFVKGRKPPQTYLDNVAGTFPQILIEVLDGAEPSFAYPENMIMCGQNDVLMVMDGASSGRTEIGFSGIIGSTLAKIICQTEKITAAYLYFYLKNKQKEIAENTTGSAIPHADRKRIEAMIVALPNQPILEAFTSFATKLLQQVWENKEQIKILSRICDSLLPRLLSGKIRVEVKK